MTPTPEHIALEPIERRIKATQDQLAYLRRLKQGNDCRVIGHDMKFIGGSNAGCDLGDACTCSVPVHECSRCKDCDYGENQEAHDIRANCKHLQDWNMDHGN